MKKAETVQVLTLAPALHERGQITFLGYVEDNPAQWPYLINTLSTNYSDPHNRVIKITDGLGAVTKIDYTQISPGGNHGLLGMHGYPRTAVATSDPSSHASATRSRPTPTPGEIGTSADVHTHRCSRSSAKTRSRDQRRSRHRARPLGTS